MDTCCEPGTGETGHRQKWLAGEARQLQAPLPAALHTSPTSSPMTPTYSERKTQLGWTEPLARYTTGAQEMLKGINAVCEFKPSPDPHPCADSVGTVFGIQEAELCWNLGGSLCMVRHLTSGSWGERPQRGAVIVVLLEHLPPGSMPLDPPQPLKQGSQGYTHSGLAARHSSLRHQLPQGYAVFRHPVGGRRVLDAPP